MKVRRHSPYRRLRAFVDWDLGDSVRSGSLSLLIGFGLFLLPCLTLAEPWRLWAGLALAVPWMGFTVWRASRMMKASAIRGDRAFDRTLRPLLGKEYQSTESATATRQRKRREDAPAAD